jgi:hypothetical protein
MNSFKQIAIAAALCIGAVSCANAATVNNSFVLQNDYAGVPGEYDQKFTITDTGADAFTGGAVTHVANNSFIDDYYFNLPESSAIDFSVASLFVPAQSVSFSTAVLYTATGEFTYDFATMSFTPTALSGSGLSLTQGEYALEITGTTLINGGTYRGYLDASPGDYVAPSAVPEPANVALMMAGLGLIGGLARRRNKKA